MIGLVGILSQCPFFKALAYQIETLPDINVENDFVLGPAKIELWLDAGETSRKYLNVTNRTGRTTAFKVEIEDFKGSRDPEQTVVLLGDEKGPYSLKDWIKPEVNEFVLNQGERMTLAVDISAPGDIEPGGHYGAVIISTKPLPGGEGEKKEKEIEGAVKVASRIGSLLFVRVKGETDENGFLKEFNILDGKRFFEKGPVTFQILFENNGSVHLTPYGIIEVRNIFGRKVDETEVNPFFAMPDSLRQREVEWGKEFLFGRYTVSLLLNRGYKDIIDTKTISFWVLPWKILSAGLAALIIMVWFLIWIGSRFEIRRKKSPPVS